MYADELQVPEVITGRLNPENANPAFAGRDLVSLGGTIAAKGKASNNLLPTLTGHPNINTVEPDARAATSGKPGSEELTSGSSNVAKQGTPVNKNYRDILASEVSKVVDPETGKPMVVYHGTGEQFNEFRYDKLGSRENKFFFTANNKSAKEYRGMRFLYS